MEPYHYPPGDCAMGEEQSMPTRVDCAAIPGLQDGQAFERFSVTGSRVGVR